VSSAFELLPDAYATGSAKVPGIAMGFPHRESHWDHQKPDQQSWKGVVMVIPAYAGSLNPEKKRETALITGASSGIGLDLARLMARDFDLIITARNQARLEEIAKDLQQQHGNQVHVIAGDLTRPEAPLQVFSELERRGLRVDVLVNNAGFGAYGAFAETDLENELEMIQVNITALTELTKIALQRMLERQSGTILNVASTAGFQPGPLMSVYYATKAYVLSFTEAISNEVRGSGVNVICFCPGATATEFAKRADMEKSLLFKLGAMSSADVARRAYLAVLQHRQGMVIPGFMNKLLLQSLRVSPRWAVLAISRRLQERAR
jgi:short-subunit dehydrogenase